MMWHGDRAPIPCPECLSGGESYKSGDGWWCASCGATWTDKPRRPVVAMLVAVVCILVIAGVGVLLLIGTWSQGR